MDGKGYPRGLQGEEIPLQARIITIVDAYDAMTAARPYREAVGDREAAAELKRCSGTQFDTDLARLFVEQVLQLSWDDLK
jgi:HD-GYP domain-containing protein (c-di-GMP phosphodiesterase class II)